MNRKEALQILRDMFDYYWAEIKEKRRDEEIEEIMEVLEQPATLADFLGWEEDVKYEWSGDWYKVKGNTISWFDAKSRVTWIDVTNIYCGVDVDLERLLEFKKNAKKVKPKLKAYYVTDKYSFSELMRELEEQGYMWASGSKLTEKCELNFSNFIFINSGEIITKDSLLRGVYDFNKKYSDKYDLIEYHKEPPKFYAKIKGWEHVEYRPHYWIKAYIRDGWYKELNKSINSNLDTAFPKYKEAYTKEEWNELGINKENADFERCNDD